MKYVKVDNKFYLIEKFHFEINLNLEEGKFTKKTDASIEFYINKDKDYIKYTIFNFKEVHHYTKGLKINFPIVKNLINSITNKKITEFLTDKEKSLIDLEQLHKDLKKETIKELENEIKENQS